MAKDKEQSMMNFVFRQNPAGVFDGADDPNSLDLTDLKIPIKGGRKKSASANTQTARSNSHPSGGRETRASTRRDSAPQQPQHVYSTDASVADQMSAVENMDPARQVKTEAQLSESQPKTRNGAGSGEHDSGDGEGDFEDEENLNAHSMNLGHEEMPVGITQRRVSGDTYPDTTSGSPSTLDQNALQDRHVMAQVQRPNYQQPVSGIRARGGGSRAIPQNAEQSQAKQLQHQNNGQSQLLPPGLYGQPGAMPASDPHGGFSFTRANPSAPNMSRSAQQPQQPRTLQSGQHQPQPQQQSQQPKPQHRHSLQPERPHSQHGKRSAPTDQAQHGSEVPPDQQLRLLKEHEQQKDVQRHDQRETRSPHDFAPPRLPSKQRADRAMSPLRPETENPSMQDQQYSDDPARGFNGYPFGNGHEEEYPAEDDNRLDYEPEVLFNMEYRTLKSHPFDSDPSAEPFALPNQEQAQTLEQKLQVVALLEPQTQANFFQSLGLDQWEEAGDWFLARFGELAGQFKDARKAKRRAAREFEDEIEQRHEAVAKKRKLTQAALDEMKESGGKVLQGTPKKGKKAR